MIPYHCNTSKEKHTASCMLTKHPGKFTGVDMNMRPDAAKFTGGVSVYKCQIKG